MTVPADPLARRLHQLARIINAIPHIDRHADCGCPRCRAHTWDTHGYPSSTLGDGTGSRGADPTSTTERQALTPHRALTYTVRYDAIRTQLAGATIAYHNLLVELGYDPANPQQKGGTTDDQVAVGRGNCLRCEKFCIGDGGNDRLRSGLCHRCKQAFSRWRQPIVAAGLVANVSDFVRHNPVRVKAV